MADADGPVTKKELDAALAVSNTALKSEFNAAMSEQRKWFTDLLAERLEAMETRLLTAFHRYAELNEDRMRKVEGEQRVDGDRLTKLEHRIRQIEERLDFPNQPRTS